MDADSARSGRSAILREVEATVPADRLVTVEEAGRLSGLSKRAIQGRIERDTLRSERRGARRLVSLVSLYEQGLIPMDAGATVSEMLSRIEALARRVGELEAEQRGEAQKRPAS
jgi:hypothetical protein